jgi:uncharacterized flavoprotein (TIGR03862 family)
LTEALVIGAGPAGLMAAEAMARAGLAVTVAEAMPTPGRKFLMAGKSGLNLTKDEPPGAFLRAYGAPWLEPALAAFGPDQVIAWARGLGQAVFIGSTGRVFPVAMKASPLLRAWLARLEGLGVTLRTRWRWTGFDGDALTLATPDGPVALTPRRTVLALGGASWARLGSDGAWASILAARGVAITPFAPANAALAVDWSPHMAPLLGAPLKGIRLTAGGLVSRGEAAITAKGLEGGGLYPLSPALRGGAPLTLDLAPDLPPQALAARLGDARQSMPNRLRRALRDPARMALALEWGRPLPADPLALARHLKALPARHAGLRPMDEAISTAGGIAASALDGGLRLRALPGIHAAGEMLDWEAPTGGYLLTACLSTGLHAGTAAALA